VEDGVCGHSVVMKIENVLSGQMMLFLWFADMS
jgi:hypothetical protein